MAADATRASAEGRTSRREGGSLVERESQKGSMAEERIVGIDLGTTNSLVAFMQGDTPVVIPGDDGSNLVPSVVALDENNQPIIGNSARRYLIETPERAVYSIKRLMGRGVED